MTKNKLMKLYISDNSGGSVVQVIDPRKRGVNFAGDLAKASLKKINISHKVKRKHLYDVLMVTSKRNQLRKNGSSIRADKSYGILLKPNHEEMIGSRILHPIFSEVTEKWPDIQYNGVAVRFLAKKII